MYDSLDEICSRQQPPSVTPNLTGFAHGLDS
jgi:hypothetical protein